MKNPINNAKGYGAVVRSAPVGMYFWKDPEKAFQIGCETAALTHGHPDAFLSAGFLACLMAHIFQGKPLTDAIKETLTVLEHNKYSETVYEAIQKAVLLAEDKVKPEAAMVLLGEGWTAEEALSGAIYCALKNPDDFEEAICLASNQNGNSNGVAAISGSILGGYLGSLEIPYLWIRNVELSDLMVHGADKLLDAGK